MREMQAPTSAVAGAGLIGDGALITDSRFFGGGPGIVDHVASEAQAGGPIATVREGRSPSTLTPRRPMWT